MSESDEARRAPWTNWQQFFPTYRFKEPHIVHLEYEAAARSLESEERVFVNAIHIAAVVGGLVSSLMLGGSARFLTSLSLGGSVWFGICVLIAFLLLLTLVALRYFAHRQRALVIAARKVVVLRRMLDLDYGTLELVLPNSRVEGARDPFMLRMFPGWFSQAGFPYWIVSVFSALLLMSLISLLLSTKGFRFAMSGSVSLLMLALLAASWMLVCSVVYRASLFEAREGPWLSVAHSLARLLHVELRENSPSIIYRAVLAVHEGKRLGIQQERLKQMLLFIEDRQFMTHSGISMRGIARAFFQFVRRRRRSGGSTITQQLARTLLVVELQKTLRRKVMEVPLAFWLEQAFEKDEILDLYLASVRFARGVMGVPAAMIHYFGETVPQPTAAQAFFLVERIANVDPGIITGRINDLLSQATDLGLIELSDVPDIFYLYDAALERSSISEALARDGLDQLRSKWCAT